MIPAFLRVEDFARWYVLNGLPSFPPKGAEVFVTDDATASCVFRHGRFQVEIYLIHPDPVIPLHEHPGVESIDLAYSQIVNIGPDPVFLEVNREGVAHGFDIRARAERSGFVMYSIQHWSEGIEMSTIGSRWKGQTAGPRHEALIRRFNPNSLVYPGYADVTKQQDRALVE